MTLGEYIKRLRKAKGWKQSEAAQRCGLKQSILSRIEAGRIARPTSDTLEKIARALDASLESLASLLAQESKPAEAVLRVGFAHCLFAAPLVLLAMQGTMLPGLEITSYGKKTGSPFALDPLWYTPKPRSRIPLAPRLNQTSQASQLADKYADTYNKLVEKEEYVIYTANELNQLLAANQIDCVVGARNVFDPSEGSLIFCARLLTAVGGSWGLLCWKSDWALAGKFENGGTNVVDDLPTRLHKDVKEGTKLVTFYPEGTTAERELVSWQESVGGDKLDPKPVLLTDWPRAEQEMEKTLNERQAFLLLCWEPVLSAVRSSVRSPDGRANSAFGKRWSGQERVPILTFDLMLTSEGLRTWAVSRTVRDFLSSLEDNIGKIKKAIDLGRTDSTIERIALYFGITPDECLNDIRRMDFELLYYPEWVRATALAR